MTLPSYPGPHPGTGTNDHRHLWQEYQGGIIACLICGAVEPPAPAKGDDEDA